MPKKARASLCEREQRAMQQRRGCSGAAGGRRAARTRRDDARRSRHARCGRLGSATARRSGLFVQAVEIVLPHPVTGEVLSARAPEMARFDRLRARAASGALFTDDEWEAVGSVARVIGSSNESASHVPRKKRFSHEAIGIAPSYRVPPTRPQRPTRTYTVHTRLRSTPLQVRLSTV